MIILGLTVFFVFVVAIIQTMQTDYYSNNYFFTALVVQWVSAIILIIFLAWWFFRKPKPVDEEAYGGVVPGDQVEGSSSSDGDHIRKLLEDNEKLAGEVDELGDARQKDAEEMERLKQELEDELARQKKLEAKLENKTKKHADQVEEAKKMQEQLLELEELLEKERERAKARKTKKGLEDTESQLELEQKLGDMLETTNKQLEADLEKVQAENEKLQEQLRQEQEENASKAPLEQELEETKRKNQDLEEQLALVLGGGLGNEDSQKVKELEDELKECKDARKKAEDLAKRGGGDEGDGGNGGAVALGDLTLLELAQELSERARKEAESADGYLHKTPKEEQDKQKQDFPERKEINEVEFAQLLLVRQELDRVLGPCEHEMEAHDLRDTIEELKKDMVVQNDELEISQRECVRLAKELEDWKQLLESTDQTEQEMIKELQETVEELQSRLDKLQQENLKELEEDNQHLRDLVESLRKEKANLEAQLEESSTKEVERITITERIETLVHEVETREITIHELEQIIIKLKEEKIVLIEKLDNGETAQSAELELQLKEALERIKDLEMELKGKDEYMASAKKQCDKDKAMLQEEVDKLRRQLDELDSSAKEAREKEIQEAYQTYMQLKPQLGIEIVDTKKNRGVLIVKVKPGRSGDIAGAEEGDVINEVDGYEIRNRKDFRNVFKNYVFAGEIVPFDIVRDRKIHRTLTFPVGAPGYSVEEVQRLRALVAHLLPDKKGMVAMPG
eukprot:TRINITY_DN12629_c0_g1_i1.p1 TRINITY_DN12629_c0_g1~~TRINITY_DN12629_c0_g1_i1.p1  ORF type:complete len:740 (+),score=367.31 TRINITY_DN12629_c0_g1_i1:214-2433(+)